MGINMDIRNEPELTFLDLNGLDEAARNDIFDKLRSDIGLKLPWDIGEKEYELPYEIVDNQVEDVSHQWQHQFYESTGEQEGIPSYEPCGPAPMCPAAMANAYSTHPPMMPYPVGEMVHYNPRIAYPPPMYLPNPEQPQHQHQHPQQQLMSASRDNERRGTRSRGGMKSYNRITNSNSNMQYMHQFPQMMCNGTVITMNPAAGPPIMFQQYNQAQQMPFQPPFPPSNRNVRCSTGQTPYYNQENTKIIHKHHEKRPNQTHYRNANSSSNNSNNNINNNTSHHPAINNNVACGNVHSTENDVDKEESPKLNDESLVQEPVVSTQSNAVPVRQAFEKNVILPEKEMIKVPKNEPKNDLKKEDVVNVVEEEEIKDAAVTNDEKVTPKVEPSKLSPPKITKIVAPERPVETKPEPVPIISFANVLKKTGPTGDVKSPPPIAKVPVTRVPQINNSPIEPINNVKNQENTPQEVKPVIMSRKNGETTPKKMTEKPVWGENKIATENNLNDPAMFRMGELLQKYQMDKQTVSLLPRGLTNRSNYCYINGILQALLACPPFYNLLMALPYPRSSIKNSPTPLIDNMVRFVREFDPLADGARMPRKEKKRREEASVDVQCGIAFEPSYVYTMLKNTSCAGVFSVEGRQEDAEEFLSCLLNGISDEMLELMKLVSSSDTTTSDPAESNVNVSNAEEGWKVMGPKNKGSITRCTEFGRTPLSDIFRGQLRSRVVRTGDETTDNVQPFFTLQLDIEKAKSVNDALDILVGKDQVEGMTCSKTKQQIEAWKQVLLEELPVILILHLKWFDYKLDGCSKIFKRVEFPIDLKLESKLLSLNVAKKLAHKQKQYKLFAVTYHDGKEASKGHYVTDAFHVGYNAWVRYDDSSVKGIHEEDVLNPTPPRVPYLLYYRRCDTIGNNQPITSRTRLNRQ